MENTENIESYACELEWWWSSERYSFSDTHRFNVSNLNDINDSVKSFIINLTRKYAGSEYEGKIERYHVNIGSLTVRPVYDTIYMYPEDSVKDFIKNEWDHVGELMENENLFINGNYNMQISEKNKNKEIEFYVR